ncbi:tetratricopeptide repeat protein [Azospirillum soli]|uniref:tetratricopeptide repeat protein n=1 Tax=Azospirillum soli TaxID=1304799 RepID=UPI001AE2D390|nr:tetratricopeptide repeat protein [Azospirillum soli]MBP2311353.1 tetratricopeptide (TPR) repeat protein [Azospirillum soli]
MASIEEALAIAVDLHQAGRSDEAEALYRRILDADPDLHGALYFLGVLLAQNGRLAEAGGLIGRAAALRADIADYHAMLGKVMQALGRAEEAVGCYRRVMLLQPDAGESFASAGVMLQNLGRGDEAITALGRAAALVPADADIRQRLALLLQLRGVRHIEARRSGQAVSDLSRALALGGASVDLFFQLGNAFARDGQSERAITSYAKAIALQPDHIGAAFNIGVLKKTSGDLEQSITMLSRVVRIVPDYLDARENLAIALYMADRVPEATAQSAELLALKTRTLRVEAAALGLPPLPEAPSAPQRRTRNVVAFSLWGDKDIYLRGAVENARLTPAVYPDWTCRFYHDDSVPATVLAELAALGADLVAMPPGSGATSGLYWRFLVSDDPEVARFVCRDCDSRLGARERAAVDAWIASGLPFHVMRDHVLHTEVILAGMWGGMAGLLPAMAPAVADFSSSEADRWQDQRFLRSRVWPLIEARCLVHDSVHQEHGVPFPGGAAGTKPYSVGCRIL